MMTGHAGTPRSRTAIATADSVLQEQVLRVLAELLQCCKADVDRRGLRTKPRPRKGYRMSKSGGVGNRRGAGELAGQVLGILQAAGEPLSPAAVRERLGGELAYTPVVPFLPRLHARGVRDREGVGGAYRYRPVADEPGLAARRMASVLAAEPDREAVLQRFVSALSEEDEQALRRMIGDSGGADGR